MWFIRSASGGSNDHNFVKLGHRRFVCDHEEELSVTRLAQKAEDLGVGVAVKIVKTLVQEEERAPYNIVYRKDKGEIAALPFAAAELVEARVR